MLTLTIYTLIVSTLLHYQVVHGKEAKRSLEKLEKKKKIQKTAETCSYRYLHGKSIDNPLEYTSPTQIVEDNKLILGKEDLQVSSTSLSPSVAATGDRITCSSINPWYQEKDR